MQMETIVWFGLMVFFLVVEGACPFHLVSIWFAVGTVAALVASLFQVGLGIQIALFLGVSCVSLALMWPLIQKVLKPQGAKTNLDSILGSMGLVTVAIDNISAKGQVKLGAMEWSARSSSGQPIEVGTQIRVDRIEGVKVYVSPVDVPAQV
jgi:membrane protein implicated in regulation of membrane protease activity